MFTAPSQSVIGYVEPHLQYKRYYVENFLEALDSPGEWYLDRLSGVLYYWPVAGEDMNTATVVAPFLPRLAEFRGTANQRVEYITLHGLSIQHADWSLARDKAAEGGYPPGAAVEAHWTRNVTIDGCEISHVGEYGLWLAESQDDRVLQSHIHDVGAGGVKITGFSASADRNVVDNSFIHDGGHVFASAYGLLLWRGSYNTVSHNEISHFFNNGINVTGSVGYGPSLAHDNSIEFNHVHHIGRGVLSDLGGIYTAGESAGTAVRNNLIHDVYAYTYGGNGLYTDEGSSSIVLENNLVYKVGNGFNHNYGRENVVRNNLFGFATESQINRGREENTLSFAFERNIVVVDNGQIFGTSTAGGNYRFEDNLFWEASGAPLNFAGLSFTEWQARGQDRNSRVADPLFSDFQSYNLQSQSPAFKLGFQPIKTGIIGLYGDPAWVGAPQRVQQFADQLLPTPGRHYIEDDFEQTAVGELPGYALVFGEENGASIRVSEETAASGRHSLKFTGAPGLAPAALRMVYQPYLTREAIRLSMDVRVDAGASLLHEWQDLSRLSAGGSLRGPSIQIRSNGDLIANGRNLMKVPLGQWTHLDLFCTLGVKADGTYFLAVTLPGQNPRYFSGLPFDSSRFTRLTYMAFYSTANQPAVFYLDNVRLVVVSTRRRP